MSKRVQKQDTRDVKLLLLGAGECGKSTVLKQMKILHGNGFTDSEKEHYKELILRNVLESIQTICRAMTATGQAYAVPENPAFARKIISVEEAYTPQASDIEQYTSVWKDPNVGAMLSKRWNGPSLLDSAPYFLDNVGRILQDDYLPDDQDILCCRLATTGVHCLKFENESKQHFRMYDVGGQRGERKQWIHCFEDVTAIFFIASLVEYDQTLAEDPTRNRLVESLALFDGIITLPWFRNADIILFLNKVDLLKKKIEWSPITPAFEEFMKSGVKEGLPPSSQEGDENLGFEKGVKFIRGLYNNKGLDENGGQPRTIFCHETTATNSENINFVWKAISHSVLTKRLDTMGMY
jgi:GTPase SAR1 family protein